MINSTKWSLNWYTLNPFLALFLSHWITFKVPLTRKEDDQKEVISTMTEGAVKDMTWIRDLKFELKNQKESLKFQKAELKKQQQVIHNQSYYIRQFQIQLWNIISNQPLNTWLSKIQKLLPRDFERDLSSNEGYVHQGGVQDTSETIEELKGALSKSQELLNLANCTFRNTKRVQLSLPPHILILFV